MMMVRMLMRTAYTKHRIPRDDHTGDDDDEDDDDNDDDE